MSKARPPAGRAERRKRQTEACALHSGPAPLQSAGPRPVQGPEARAPGPRLSCMPDSPGHLPCTGTATPTESPTQQCTPLGSTHLRIPCEVQTILHNRLLCCPR